jgi:cytochrome oxidase Cu insertion factor (SCO1/SenC/PrrC family)
MRKLKIAGIVLGILLLAGAVLAWQAMQLPPPQIASAEGKTAPDFLLQDQQNREFRLHDLRGERVVLVFYRGHW